MSLAALVVIILLALVNAALGLESTFLAAGGSASLRAIVLIWVSGITIASFVLWARNSTSTAVWLAVFTLPLGYIAGIGSMFVAPVIEYVMPSPNWLDAACKGSGPNYLSPPSQPVKSIAFDWKEGVIPPKYQYFEIGAFNRISNLRGAKPWSQGDPRTDFPEAISFTETRCCWRGMPEDSVRPYVRFPNSLTDMFFGITDLSADALVTYATLPIEAEDRDERIRHYTVEVVDRRDGRKLAELRYVVDSTRNRGCGATSDGVMDEKAFVLKAVGVVE